MHLYGPNKPLHQRVLISVWFLILKQMNMSLFILLLLFNFTSGLPRKNVKIFGTTFPPHMKVDHGTRMYLQFLIVLDVQCIIFFYKTATSHCPKDHPISITYGKKCCSDFRRSPNPICQAMHYSNRTRKIVSEDPIECCMGTTVDCIQQPHHTINCKDHEKMISVACPRGFRLMQLAQEITNNFALFLNKTIWLDSGISDRG